MTPHDVRRAKCGYKRGESQCCCDCIFRRPVHVHCDGKRRSADGQHCGCHDRVGWACAHPEIGRVYSPWPEHSAGCEVHTRDPNIKT